jgi:hypothetical protein
MREIKEQVYWEDCEGIIHLCDNFMATPNDRLVYTRCEIDVPPNEGFIAKGKKPSITCNMCIALGADGTQYPKTECPFCGSLIVDGKCEDVGGNNCQYTEE